MIDGDLQPEEAAEGDKMKTAGYLVLLVANVVKLLLVTSFAVAIVAIAMREAGLIRHVPCIAWCEGK